jgi:CheY-like chemotaxis protein/HAMP domain-containing protein
MSEKPFSQAQNGPSKGGLDPNLLLSVLTAAKNGDFSVRLPLDWTGVNGKVADTFNEIMDLNQRMSTEIEKMSRTVGREGKLSQRINMGRIDGGWAASVDGLNNLITDLTFPISDMTRTVGAVAKGDLSQTMVLEVEGRPLQGEFKRTATTVNAMVAQLNTFTAEVTRVTREVGTDGKLGGQADVKDVSGTWKDLTDNVNLMASNLTNQVRNIADVTTAVANGNLTRKITVDAKGEILELKNTINVMVDQLRSFAGEVTRVAREVGTDGKLGGQAIVPGVGGVWKDLTDNVNGMAGNLTSQVRNIADVTTAVARGDLTRKITADARGEILELKNTINVMVDQLRSFAGEVTRVAREVGTDGKLGGQADVKDVAGTWKDLTDNVNLMASNLTNQVRNIADVTIAVANGDLSKKIIVDVRGEFLQLKDTMNTMVDQLRSFAGEVTRVAREVGTDGKLGGQAEVRGVAGVWKDLTDNVNGMANNLTVQLRDVSKVATAIARGDMTQKITVDVKGEILQIKETINTMVDQLNSFAAEVTRVAREVGTEGKLGGQAQVQGVSGTWKDLTDNVNLMANNLTDQVRGIAKVVTAIASGNLKQKLQLTAKGEIATLADTINSMIDTLATFADQVTGVAREVGVEGRLGGQADVPGAAGTWLDLTDNVNQLAANLTNQVRAIAEVATAVTKGDLTRTVTVEARGELAELKDNVNEMIRNLRETTTRNTDQDWLKTNLAKFTRMLQGQRDITTVSKTLMSELAPIVNAKHGVFYVMEQTNGTAAPTRTALIRGVTSRAVSPDGGERLKLLSSYAFKERKQVATSFALGEGLVGQAALEKERILLTNVPGDYIQISSGLGEASPLNIVVLPVVFEGTVKAVIELASFNRFSETYLSFLEQLTESIGIVLNTIEANMRTEELLKQSQSLAEELQSQQEELQQTNEELQEKARLLSEQKSEVERKNLEVEQARHALEEKAEQLAISSKYKSEFLANMSHELRTPLNSLLILAQQLSENLEGNLNAKQISYARTVHASGLDLLNLINDILDLSKIESGTVTVEADTVFFTDERSHLERTFRHIAVDKGLEFNIELAPSLPRLMITDAKRLQQVLKNLLSNAFKFTERGRVNVRMETATSGWSAESRSLNRAGTVIAFSVSDTGIGIPADKQKIIFEAFQQADGTTSRKYGGTGLGLAISREIAVLLGGELRLVRSAPGEGSTFVIFLPQNYTSPSDPTAPLPPQPGPDAQTDGVYQLAPAAVSPPPPVAASESQPTMRGTQPTIRDDREDIEPGDRVLLIVEDDPNFAGILLDLAHEKGFKGLIALRGEEALTLVNQYAPTAITLDLFLPDIDGWTVLDRLKINSATRHIPVHIISVEESRELGLKRGAFAFLEKPVSKEMLNASFARLEEFLRREKRNLLVVEDDPIERERLVGLIGNGDVMIKAVASAEEAQAILAAESFDCLVLDLKLPGMSGFDLLERLNADAKLRDLPVIVYTGKDPTQQEKARLEKLTRDVIFKEVHTPERLLAKTALFLHRMSSKLPEAQRQMLEKFYQTDIVLTDKKLLVVDDDIRNIFALTTVLERHKMEVYSAESGQAAIDLLDKTPGINVVLMDIMMPEMDGYETMRAIRKMPKWKSLPIIALTAKAMKGDREKCIEAGASDYITKPVNTEQLLSLLRIWLYQ